jgi:hypothetical protein
MRSHKLVAAVSAFLIAAWLGACDQGSLPSAPSGSFVRIVSVSPDTGTALKVGDRVKMQVEVSYALSSDGGTVSLVVQAANNASLAHNMEVIQKGSGKATLSAEFVVPDSNAVQIFTPLSAQGQTSTSTVDHRAYKVIK